MKNLITDLYLKLIWKINRSKSNCLSERLFELAELYNTKPGNFNYRQQRRCSRAKHSGLIKKTTYK